MIAVTLVQITRCGSFHGILYLETCFGDVPLPLGEGGAKRRVRVLLPEGEGQERRFCLIGSSESPHGELSRPAWVSAGSGVQECGGPFPCRMVLAPRAS